MRTLEQLTHGENWIGLGIAGNQAGHLNQAGEAGDFDHLEAEDNRPKGIFPWYVPSSKTFLGVNPLSSSELHLRGNDCIQPETEIGLLVEFNYSDSLLKGVEVKAFTIFNDCSRRLPEPKLSLKKNWGDKTQGMGSLLVEINDFNQVGGVIDDYRLVCYLKRGGNFIQYAEDAPVSGYSYLNQQLTNWLVNQINTQKDNGPLEDLTEMFSVNKVRYGVVAIGATCYTDFGNGKDKFLVPGDEVIMVAYNGSKYHLNDVESCLRSSEMNSESGMLLLSQKVFT